MSSVKTNEFYTEVYVPISKKVYEYPALNVMDEEEKKAELLDTRVTRFFIPTKDGERITAVKRSIRNLYDAMYYDMPKDKEGYAEQINRRTVEGKHYEEHTKRNTG